MDSGSQFTLNAKHSGAGKLPKKYTYLAVLNDGCMPEADTAVYNWNVHPPLAAMLQTMNIPVQDTTLCYGQNVLLESSGMGGKGGMYNYLWKFDGNNYATGNSILLQADRLYDSLITTGKTTMNLTLEMQDGCTGISNSVSVEITLLAPLQLQLQPLDTLCYGNDHLFKAVISGGVQKDYSFNWKLNGSAVSADSSFAFDFNDFLSGNGKSGVQNITVSLEDGCSQPSSSDSFGFLIMDPLSLSIVPDKICADPDVLLQAMASGGKKEDYIINWLDENGAGIDTGLQLTLTPVGAVKVFAVLSDNCTYPQATDSLVVYPQPRIFVSQSDTAGCEPLELVFTLTKETNTDNLYSFFQNNQKSDTFSSSEHKLRLIKGQYTYKLEVQSEGGCTNDYVLKPVEVWPLPQAEFSWSPADPTWNDETITLKNLSKGGTSYLWDIEGYGQFTEVSPVLNVNDTGSHFILLTAITDKGCLDTSGKLLVIGETFNFYIPNSFTPNQDELNETFKPEGTGIASYTITIYNRWGQMIFAGDQNHHWDGTYLGQAVMEGTYYYVISVITIDQEKSSHSGTVVLIR